MDGTRKGCERDPSFSLARGWGRPFSRVLNIFMMAAGAGGAAWKWRVGGGCRDGGESGGTGGGGVRGWLDRMGWGGWMEEGGQAERSTRGGLRGPRGPRGEKLEKGRFKYQPPRGGPRACCLYLASFFLSRTGTSPARALSLTTLALPPSYHPSSFFAYAHTQREPRTERYVHRQTLTHTSIDPRPEKRRLRAVRRWRTPVRQCYVLIGRPLPTLLFFADRRTFLI